MRHGMKLLSILLMGAVILVGCMQQQQPPGNQTATGMDQIYRFDSVKSFTYSRGARGPAPPPAQGFDEITITSGTFEGRAVWVERVHYVYQRWNETALNYSGGFENIPDDVFWVDKSTFECLNKTTNDFGIYAFYDPCQSQLEYSGNMTISTPYGNLNCDEYVARGKYSVQGVKGDIVTDDLVYYVVKTIPVPLEIQIGSYTGYHSTAALVNYT